MADGSVEEIARLGVELPAELVLLLAGTERPEQASNNHSQDKMAITAVHWKKTVRFECVLSAGLGKRQDIF